MDQATPVCAKPTRAHPQGRTGTYAGYQAHLKARDEICAHCRAANAERSARRDADDSNRVPYMQRYAHENKGRIAAYNRDRRDQRQDIIDKMKDVPCADCGGRFPPVCMDFDHVRGAKSFSISRASTRSMERVLIEIEKCEVVCSNCHRIRTAERAEVKRKHPKRGRRAA